MSQLGVNMNDYAIENVRNLSSIEELFSDYAKVKRKGSDVFVVCPFHSEKTPSLHVEPERGVFYCHGCGASGDIFTIPMKLEGLGFIDAVQYVADRFNINVDNDLGDEENKVREDMRAALQVAFDYFHYSISNSPASEYLADRKISEQSIRDWGLGYCPSSSSDLVSQLRDRGLVDAAVSAGVIRISRGLPTCVFSERVIFPIRNKIGQLVSFAGRDITGNAKAKYINGKETTLYRKSNVLFGIQKAIPAIREWSRVILVEGYFDVIALHQAEITESVAACGTALTKDHIKLFSKLTDKALCFFDSDDAGRRAASKALPMLAKNNIDSLMVNLPDGMDPADYATSKSLEELMDRIEEAEPLLSTWLRSLSRSHDKTPHGRQAAANEAVPVIRSYPPVARDVVLRQVSDILSVPYAALKRLVGQPAPKDPDDLPKSTHDPLALALAGILMRNEGLIKGAKKTIKLEWIDGEEERCAIEKLLDGEPAYTVARKAAEELQPKLHRIAVGIGSDDPERSLGKVVSRIEMRHLSRELPKQPAESRLEMQKRRLELQRKIANL
jgi:DNA primase